MQVVKGAVNTLIVCWADNRAQIEIEHPDMSKMLVEAWQRSFPHSHQDFPPGEQGIISPVATGVPSSSLYV